MGTSNWTGMVSLVVSISQESDHFANHCSTSGCGGKKGMTIDKNGNRILNRIIKSIAQREVCKLLQIYCTHIVGRTLADD